jgi:hypothetical protein
MYARSDWGTGAVWVSLAAGEIVMDHQHYDQGHITIQRGADYLLVDGGGYGEYTTDKHNTLLFDDRGAGNISTYPPGQGEWGFNSVAIKRFEPKSGYVYGLADFTRSYAQAHDGIANSVKAAVRSVVFVRPGMYVVHDRAQTFNANVKKTFNCNFGNSITQVNGVWKTTVGASTLFVKSLEPGAPQPTITAIANEPLAKSNYQELLVGQASNDFLHVFEAAASTQAAMTPCSYVDAGTCEGAEFKLADSAWVALFGRTDSIVANQIAYAYHYSGPQRHLITDLAPHAGYAVKVVSRGQTVYGDSSHSASDNGTATFAFSSADSGTVTLVPGKVPVANGVVSSPNKMGDPVVRMSGRVLSISMDLAAGSSVNVSLYDCAGRKVITLVNTNLGAGTHSIRQDLSKVLRAGSYVVRITAGKYERALEVAIW